MQCEDGVGMIGMMVVMVVLGLDGVCGDLHIRGGRRKGAADA